MLFFLKWCGSVSEEILFRPSRPEILSVEFVAVYKGQA